MGGMFCEGDGGNSVTTIKRPICNYCMCMEQHFVVHVPAAQGAKTFYVNGFNGFEWCCFGVTISTIFSVRLPRNLSILSQYCTKVPNWRPAVDHCIILQNHCPEKWNIFIDFDP